MNILSCDGNDPVKWEKSVMQWGGYHPGTVTDGSNVEVEQFVLGRRAKEFILAGNCLTDFILNHTVLLFREVELIWCNLSMLNQNMWRLWDEYVSLHLHTNVTFQLCGGIHQNSNALSPIECMIEFRKGNHPESLKVYSWGKISC